MGETTQESKALATRPANGEVAGLAAAALAQVAQPAPPALPGYEGAGTVGFPADVAVKLLAPVDPAEVEIREDGIVFLPWTFYQDRLLEAFGPGGFTLVPVGPPKRDGDTVLYHGRLYCLGRFIGEAIGECTYRAGNYGMTYASALEGARSDCLVRCCKVLGVARELWRPVWRRAFMEAHSWWEEKPGYQGRMKKVFHDARREPRPGQAPAAPPKVAAATKPAAAAKPVAPPPPPPSPPAAEHPQVIDAEWRPTGDTGEPITPESSKRLRAILTKDLKWAVPHAKNWLGKLFGVDSTDALTAQNGKDAETLALARQASDEAYDGKLAELRAAGRVRPEETL